MTRQLYERWETTALLKRKALRIPKASVEPSDFIERKMPCKHRHIFTPTAADTVQNVRNKRQLGTMQNSKYTAKQTITADNFFLFTNIFFPSLFVIFFGIQNTNITKIYGEAAEQWQMWFRFLLAMVVYRLNLQKGRERERRKACCVAAWTYLNSWRPQKTRS